MSAQQYITIDDLTYKPLKNAIALITAQGGSLDEFQDLVDRCNDFYEDICQQVEVEIGDILFPIPILSMEMLNYRVTYMYAQENAGQVQQDQFGPDMYIVMAETTYKFYRTSLLSMTKQYVSGTATADDRISVTFGSFVRG